MTDRSTTEIRHAVTVPVDPATAFEVFTQRMGEWWPAEHAIGASPKVGISLDPRVGGEVRELGEDGTGCLTGRVLAWEPPDRVVISWQITARWMPEPDPARASEYEARFTAIDGGTRVEVTHRHLERHGDDDGRSIGAAVDGPQGWPYVLASLALFTADAGGS